MECCWSRAKETDMPYPRDNYSVIEVEERPNDTISCRLTTWVNRASVASWLLFTLFLFTQPWMANWANNYWWNYSADYVAYADDGSVDGVFPRQQHWYSGMCSKPAHEMKCTNGEDAVKLAWIHRGAPVVCGFGQGIYGEALCPTTYYGFTVSDYVCTAPSLAAMLGLSVCPILGSVHYTIMINEFLEPSAFEKRIHSSTIVIFMLAYFLWGICTSCLFPVLHSVLTVVFIAAFAVHWKIKEKICSDAGKVWELEVQLTKNVTKLATMLMLFGAFPRIFLKINDVVGQPLFANWNRGPWAHLFWLAEAMALSLTFGIHPFCVIGHHWRGDKPFVIGRSTN